MQSMVFGIGAAQTMNHNYRAFASEGYALNSVVHACVDKIRTAASSVDICVYEERNGKRRKLESHVIKSLMEKPNPLSSGTQFISSLLGYYLIGGNAFIYGNGMIDRRDAPREIYLIPPEAVTITPGTSIFPKLYEKSTSSGSRTAYAVDQLNGRSDILHLKTFNPLDVWRGLSPMVAAAFGVDVFNSGQRWNLALLQNGARPPGALMVEQSDGTSAPLSDDQFYRLRSQIEEQYSGPSNAGRPLLLEGGLKWVEMGVNPKDMDFRESMLTMARFVASVYGVPPMLVNIPGESTYSNYETAREAFWTETVLPLLRTILDDFNRWFAPILGDGVYLWYDEEMIPALEPMRKMKGERINAANYLTLQEKRAAMGYSSKWNEGETLLVSSSSIPVELAGATALPEMGSPADTVNA